MGEVPRVTLKFYAFKMEFRKHANNKSRRWKSIKTLEEKINEEYSQAKFKFNYKVDLKLNQDVTRVM